MRGILLIVLVGLLLGLGAMVFLPPLQTWWSGQPTGESADFLARPEGNEERSGAPSPEQAAGTPGERETGSQPAAVEEHPVLASAPRPDDVLAPALDPEVFRADLESVDRRAIGRLIAHEERYQVLESYLNEGEGRKLPEAARKLVSAFWLALNGQPAEAERLASDLDGSEGVTSDQVSALRAAIEGEHTRARPASGARVDVLALGMRMALLDRLAAGSARKGEHEAAAEAYSELLQVEVSAPWDPEREDLRRWMLALNQAQEHGRWDPRGTWPSLTYEVVQGDNLVSIRKQLVEAHPELLLCVGLIRRANQLEDRPLQPGQALRIPTDPPHVLVDLDSQVLLFLQGDEVAQAWEVGIGVEGQETPTGTFTVGLKQENPSYMPIGGPNVPFGHPDNPLGTRWIAWYRGEERTGYGFHGTNDPSGVGARVSKGCVRMRNPEVEALFDVLPIGAQVVVQP